LFRSIGAVDNLDAAALAAPPRMDLRLNDNASTQSLRYRASLARAKRYLTLWDRKAYLRKQCFGLILVNLHKTP
jgi:hypothetical protein